MEICKHTFSSGKSYVYVKTPQGPIFLRNILFLVNGLQIAVVRSWGGGDSKHVWEPPKGQMEWKEFGSESESCVSVTQQQLFRHAKHGVLREMSEEANLCPSEIRNLHPLPLAYTEDWKECGIPNAKFSYQYWQAELSESAMKKARQRMAVLRRNPEWQHILPADMTEKDDICWWSPSTGGWDMIRGKFSEKMTRLYFKFKTMHGV